MRSLRSKGAACNMGRAIVSKGAACGAKAQLVRSLRSKGAACGAKAQHVTNRNEDTRGGPATGFFIKTMFFCFSQRTLLT